MMEAAGFCEKSLHFYQTERRLTSGRMSRLKGIYILRSEWRMWNVFQVLLVDTGSSSDKFSSFLVTLNTRGDTIDNAGVELMGRR